MKTHRILLIALLAFACALALRVVPHQIRTSRPIDFKAIQQNGKVSPAARSLRPNYPYSVIAGGAYSPAELRYANEKDRLVRDHYADFDLKAARLVTLADDRYQYVSFRLKNRVYWTRNKLRIPRGEVLLTDGRNYARTRCGNRLSSSRQSSTTAEQPSPKLLSLPSFRPELLNVGDVELAPARTR